ncbi:hypothetical protein [uncultured Sphaerochaeta sp.]|uniref:hypothetical protein n=1 Tax=uncultured Sphaerochaeta sp. TaxID=886478 RepID=UPI002A0A4C16|nr:hypothetical protein [uncultured Sphaerochaeta sp.]
MLKKYARGILALLVVSLYIPPLFSASLGDIVKNALGSSSQMKMYLLSKQNAELAVSIDEADDQLGIEIRSGDLSTTYSSSLDAYVLSSSGSSVTFTLPDDGDTTISVGTGSTDYIPTLSAYATSPYLSATHTITFGETGDNRSALLGKQNTLLGGYTYENSVTNFKTSLYQQIISLLTTEKNIKDTEKQIADIQTELDNALKLKILTPESLSFQEKNNSLESLKGTLASLQANSELVKQQYTSLTDLNWEGVTDIPDPELSFSTNPNGNSQVKLKMMALEIAKEDFKVEQARQTNRILGLSGSVTLPTANATNTLFTKGSGVKSSLGAELSGKTFSLGASASASYDFDSGKINPGMTISGSWNNDNTSLVDTLILQEFENKVLLAQIEYNNTLSEYLYDASSLIGELASWKLSHSLLENAMQYHRQVLVHQKDLFARGLARQADVLAASFMIEQDSYDFTIDMLKGLVLQNKIHSLEL